MAEQHPIEALMTTAMQSIKEMVDVNTIVGDAVQAPDGTVIIPISKVNFGFAAGGGEYNYTVNVEGEDDDSDKGEGKEQTGGRFHSQEKWCRISRPVAFMVVKRQLSYQLTLTL